MTDESESTPTPTPTPNLDHLTDWLAEGQAEMRGRRAVLAELGPKFFRMRAALALALTALALGGGVLALESGHTPRPALESGQTGPHFPSNQAAILRK